MTDKASLGASSSFTSLDQVPGRVHIADDRLGRLHKQIVCLVDALEPLPRSGSTTFAGDEATGVGLLRRTHEALDNLDLTIEQMANEVKRLSERLLSNDPAASNTAVNGLAGQ